MDASRSGLVSEEEAWMVMVVSVWCGIACYGMMAIVDQSRDG